MAVRRARWLGPAVLVAAWFASYALRRPLPSPWFTAALVAALLLATEVLLRRADP